MGATRAPSAPPVPPGRCHGGPGTGHDEGSTRRDAPVLAVGFSAVLAAAAVALSARRDLGAGLLPPRLCMQFVGERKEP